MFDHIIPCNHTINWRESPSFAISPFHHCLLGKIFSCGFSDAIKGSFWLGCALLGLTTIEVELRIESVFGYIGNFQPLIFPFSSFHHFQRRWSRQPNFFPGCTSNLNTDQFSKDSYLPIGACAFWVWIPASMSARAGIFGFLEEPAAALLPFQRKESCLFFWPKKRFEKNYHPLDCV